MEYVISWKDVKRKAGLMLDIESIFSYHSAPTPEIQQLHDGARNEVRLAAEWIEENVPECAEKTLAIRHLQQAMMFTNSAIAQHVKE